MKPSHLTVWLLASAVAVASLMCFLAVVPSLYLAAAWLLFCVASLLRFDN